MNTTPTISPNPIALDYPTSTLRLLVEEYLARQKGTFTLKGVCSYILSWAMEDGRTLEAGKKLYETNHLHESDCERISQILERSSRMGESARWRGRRQGI